MHRIADYKPVFADALAGNLEAVRAAAKNDRAVLTGREWDDATLLHLAVGQNHLELAEFLLDEGADVHALTDHRLAALHMAAQNGNMEIVRLLLDKRADMNAVDAKGWTPLDRATKWRHADVAEFLRQHGGHGVIGGLADNADKLGALVAGVTVAWRAGMASTAVDAAKPDPAAIDAARKALAAAIAAGKLPNL